MSQIIKNLASGGPLPPQIPTSFTTDYNATFGSPGNSIPLANVEIIVGGTNEINNDNGIATQADPNDGNNLIVLLTNRLFGGVSTVGALTSDLITFTLSPVITNTAYRFEFQVVGKSVPSGDALGYTMFASAKTNGTTASIIETPYLDVDQDASMVDASIAFVPSGNSVILQVTGVAGQTITYKAVGTYIQI